MDNEYLDIIGLGIFKALNDKRYPILVNGKISESAIPTSITNSITSILSLIPDAASSENKLADKNFVNSSIATNTATFRGTFDDLATLQATSADINDYAFYVHTDEIGNTAYDRYKHNGSTWVFEYTLNNSSFTAEQWSAINSGITTTKVGNYDAHLINYSNPHKVTKSQVGLGNVENVALSSWAGSNKITTLGTITTGVWNGTKITNTYLANSSITIGTTAISLGSTAKSLAGIEKLQLNDANSNLVYDSTTGSWKLTGNLLVTGFISAGAKGNSSSGGGSTYTQREWAEIKIMSASEIGLLASAYSVKEAYNELNTAIETLAGKATNVTFSQALTSGKQIGSISIDGKSTSLFAPANYAWSEITGKPSFATVATSGSYTDLTNKPTIASLMGSTAIGGTSSYLYWNGSAWATKALGSNAFTSISKVSQLTNDSGYITGITKAMVENVLTGNITSHTHSYLPLSGGTISSSVTTLATFNSTGSESGIRFQLNNVPKGWAGYNATYGTHLFTYADSAGDGANHTLGLRSNGTGYIDTNTILHSGNYGSYALPLSGGTMSNTNVVTNLNADTLDGYHAAQVLTANYSDTVDLNEISVPSIYRLSTQNPNLPSSLFRYGNLLTVKAVSADTAWQLIGSYGNDALWFRRGTWYADGTGTLRTNAWKAIAFTDSNVASSSKWANARTITLTGSVTGSVSIDGSANVSLNTTTNHTHTFDSLTSKPTTISGYGITDAYTKTETNTKLSEYLPLTGGTISITSDEGISINRTNGTRGVLSFKVDGGYKGGLGIDTDGVPFYRTYLGDIHTLIHSGNYNSYAPKLDGTGASGTWGISISGNAATATNADTLDGYHASISSKPWGTIPVITKNGWMEVGKHFEFHYDNTTGSDYSTLLACTGNYSNTVNLPSKSGTLALLTDNVASATQLQTSRTIWGQSFNGTGNVSGAPSFPSIIDINRNVDTGVFIDSSKIGFEIETFANDVRLKTYSASGVANPTHLVLTSGGNVLIGTTTDNGKKLQVAGSILADLGNNGGVLIGHIGNTIDGYVNGKLTHLHLNYTSSGNLTMCKGGGNVGIGTTSPSYKLHIVGTAYSSAGLITDGAISAAKTSTSSDIRLKENISEIGSKKALNWLLMLKPKSWTWNDKAGVKGASMGFVAQEVEGILPQMVKKQDNGYLSLDYTQLHALEVSAIQSHENEIERLKDRVSELEAEINRLKQYAN